MLRSHGSLLYAGRSSQDSLNAAKETYCCQEHCTTKPSQAKSSQVTTQTFNNICNHQQHPKYKTTLRAMKNS
ncbi:hypothetical protein E2C01_067878 [Portunus trituberculatus]|uniref:Uncharacterized protein n=1 Tax=Portunus trituberculatus TaxID=210409 RepID=A0A5B7HYL2_PORTR|nr:hypothetical protein [Portunus trituberculatus]